MVVLLHKNLFPKKIQCVSMLNIKKKLAHSSIDICIGILDHSLAYLTGCTCSCGSLSTCILSNSWQKEALRSYGQFCIRHAGHDQVYGQLFSDNVYGQILSVQAHLRKQVQLVPLNRIYRPYFMKNFRLRLSKLNILRISHTQRIQAAK